MRKIWKFPVPIDQQEVSIQMPRQAMVLPLIAIEKDCVVFWAAFDLQDEHNWVTRTFQVFGTGHVIPSDMAYVATCQDPTGLMTFVWHLHEYVGKS